MAKISQPVQNKQPNNEAFLWNT